jgi:hypothetical protein
MVDRTKIAVQDKRTVELSEQSSLLGPRPLIEGEDAAAYDEILARLSGTMKPKDVLEEIWVRDVVDLTWDTLRMRRLKAALLASAMSQAIDKMFTPILGYRGAEELSKQWALRDRQTVKRVDQLIASMGLTMEAVVAQALSIHIDSFERIDRMVMHAEGRRNAALRELERHRATLAQALRQASNNVVEAEFDDLAPAQRRLAANA